MIEFQLDKKLRMEYNESTGMWDYYKNEKLLSKEAEKLFKFYSLNINNIDALLNNYFHLSNPNSFNDPFDCNINLTSNIEDKQMSKFKTVKRNSISNIGISSFSEAIDSHLMWAHYTNNYMGFAIEFNGNDVIVKATEDRFEKITLTEVLYPQKIKKIKKEFPFALHYVLSTKMKHWEYEKEWRIICQLKNGDDRILYYYPQKVRGIYIGHRLIDEDKSAYRLLLEICAIRFQSVPIFVVYPHPKELELVFEKITN